MDVCDARAIRGWVGTYPSEGDFFVAEAYQKTCQHGPTDDEVGITQLGEVPSLEKHNIECSLHGASARQHLHAKKRRVRSERRRNGDHSFRARRAR